MKQVIYQIDAFAKQVFEGNPAAVCPLETWLSDSLMQRIALENNLSETAFFVREGSGYRLRWFTPETEIDLCGHGTLAAAYVIVCELGDTSSPIVFQTRSGELRVSRTGDAFTLDFPSQPPRPCEVPERLLKALGIATATVTASQDYIVEVDSEGTVRGLVPDFELLRGLPLRGVAVTARGDSSDFVSRWFGPNVGVNEDPVTGSAHCALTPYWAEKLGLARLTAVQVSKRGGNLVCELVGERVLLTGHAARYLVGEISVSEL